MYKALEIRDNMKGAETASISICLKHRVRWALTRDDTELVGREQTKIVHSLMMGMEFIFPSQFSTGLR